VHNSCRGAYPFLSSELPPPLSSKAARVGPTSPSPHTAQRQGEGRDPDTEHGQGTKSLIQPALNSPKCPCIALNVCFHPLHTCGWEVLLQV
jgi:hypothetical protein